MGRRGSEAGRYLLSDAAEKILSVPMSADQSRFVKALSRSLRQDFGNYDDPNIVSPMDLREMYGIPLEVMLNFHIIVDRKNAHELLADFGFEVSIATLSKKYFTGHRYEHIFRRCASKVGNKYVYTYAEVMHLVEFSFDLRIPPELESVL